MKIIRLILSLIVPIIIISIYGFIINLIVGNRISGGEQISWLNESLTWTIAILSSIIGYIIINDQFGEKKILSRVVTGIVYFPLILIMLMIYIVYFNAFVLGGGLP
jgi:hypothetical protein